MNYFKRYNNIAGWVVFAIAALVYTLTIEPTSSLWDCSEFIATSYKLEVGHPPGAPLFMMIARFFTIFAGPQHAAMMVNEMSALASAFTILFLFWSITHLARRIYDKQGHELSAAEVWTVIGAGAVGALAYTFTDTFWFSAVEGEVYALSSMFTALVFWAILKWENVADEPHSNRWLILIAYFMGLSIGIHILNLLTIPALVFVYYFKKYPGVTFWGVVKATGVAVAILGVINALIIPYTVAIGAWVDRMFVNGMGLPVNSGLTFFVLALFALLGCGIWYTHKKGKAVVNAILLCTTVIMIGFGSYASVVIRAAANPPMNSNNPNNPYALQSLLNRDQYGARPLLKGPMFSSPPIAIKEKTVYSLGDDGKYEAARTISGYEYPPEFEFFFPRLYSSKDSHVRDYKTWVPDMTGKQVPLYNRDRSGNIQYTTDIYGNKVPAFDETITVPTFGDNLRYFFSYQLNFMYWRYFLWNFVGRQSDIQSTGEITNGNWLSGIKFIDQLYLGPQDNLPSEMKDNRGRNTYFFLPFILGLIGLIYQLNRDKRNFTVVMWLFFMMGIALVLYFNSAPSEPRERDYVYAGSFYAFCIWIGFGVMWLADLFAKYMGGRTVAGAVSATLVCMTVPTILAAQNWDDHDRSHRYVARDIGWDYLQSALPNSIVMNYADNDAFPLWYNQEVEGVRTDVRVMNMSYLGADWYIDEMKTKVNESDAVPFTLPRSKYVNTNDYVSVKDERKYPVAINQVIKFILSEEPNTKMTIGHSKLDYINAKQILLPVNKINAVESGIVRKEDAHLMVDTVLIDIKKDNLTKDELMLLDLLAHFDWKRPLYFTQTHLLSSLGLRDYLQFDGFAYRFVPIRTPAASSLEVGRVDSEYLYDKLMNTFRYGNVKDPRVYCDYFVQHNYNAAQVRNGFARLAQQLVAEGDTVRAVAVLDRGVEELPFKQIRHSYIQTIPMIEAYYAAGATDKANAILADYAGSLKEYIRYFDSFPKDKAQLVTGELRENLGMLSELYRIAEDNHQAEQCNDIRDFFRSIGYE